MKDITNSRFGRLVVLTFDKRIKRKYYWITKCDCGKIRSVWKSHLINGHTKSCGCLLKDCLVKRNTTHGNSKTRFYKIWKKLNDRCNNPKCKDYKYYGGRGIKKCLRWYKFENFHKDMFEKYAKHIKKFGIKNTTIDRINNNKGYYPHNCRWATMLQQVRNRNKYATK